MSDKSVKTGVYHRPRIKRMNSKADRLADALRGLIERAKFDASVDLRGLPEYDRAYDALAAWEARDE